MNPLTQFKTTTPLLLIPTLLACLALAPAAQAVSPAPDGGYPGFNTAEGDDALFSLTTGSGNTAIGFQALYNNNGNYNTATGDDALYSNTIGFDNTATGQGTLTFNTTGDHNTATGARALINNTSGGENTATGFLALASNTTGNDNTATGILALLNNTTGGENTANGVQTLLSNTTGSGNTATGSDALLGNTSGNNNTANGAEALSGNASGIENTADGANALFSNTVGFQNTATGADALSSNTTAFANTADGVNALYGNTTGNNNTATGVNALKNNTTGSNNIALGINAGQNLSIGDNNIDIGNVGVGAEANTIRVGTQGTQTNTYVAGISGSPVARGAAVVVDVAGHLGIKTSSQRFKERIKPMANASEAILALKPVSFQYKKEIDPEGTPQFGLVAEEVEKVNPDLVVRDAQGKVYTVRYDAVNAMLLNEFLKAHRKAQQQEATITELKKEVETVVARLKKQDSKIQKVSDRIEMSKPAPRVACLTR